jgi:hypothetical protein
MGGAVEVHCSNCGGDTLLAILGLAVAAAALAVALIALGIARRQLTIDERQHEEFLRVAGAYADFILRLRFPYAEDDGVVYTEASGGRTVLEIGLNNGGTKAAGPTLINVVFPSEVFAQWCGPNGEDIAETSKNPAPAGERFQYRGEEVGGSFLSQVMPNVGLRPHYTKHVRFVWGGADEGPVEIPFIVKAQADELIEDEVVEEIVFHGRRRRVWNA